MLRIKVIIRFVHLLTLGLPLSLFGQQDSLSNEFPFVTDTLGVQIDSTGAGGDSLKINISKDALDSPVRYHARDTQWIDMRTKQVHLIGGAEVTYQDIQLNAGYIIFSFETNVVTATGIMDSLGELVEKPIFKQGSQSFNSLEMRYNFRTKKGTSKENATLEGDLHVLSEKAKYVGAISETDNDKIYGSRSMITTCDLKPTPHYGIRITKQKVIPNKTVIAGPSNIEIAGVPTPIWLPFGFFPIATTRKAGLVFSLDYDYRQELGYGLRGIGYFTPIGEYANFSILGDIYTRGSYRLSARTQYNKRYLYSGNAELTWTDFALESPETGEIQRDRLFRVIIQHNQDPKANPYHNLSGRIQFESSAFSRLNYYDANNVLANTVSSSMNYRRTWEGKPYQLTVSITQSQNLRSGRMDVTLPDANFVMQRIQPFKRKGGGTERWYERIGTTYNANAVTRLSGPDSTFFSSATLETARPGLRQSASVNSNFNLFRYFNFTPNITYNEVWNYNTLRRENDMNPVIRLDTIFNADNSILRIDTTILSYGTVQERLVNDFKTYRNLSANINMNTAIFGTVRFSKGWLRGLRHTIKPNVGLTFSPGNTNRPWFDEYARGREADYSDLQRYSYFEGGPFGAPNFTEGAMSMTYSLNNIFEAKYFSKKDTLSKKVNLFDNIIVSGSYNFFADSLKWSPVRIGGGTNLFKRMSRFDVGITLDPYAVDSIGRSINQFYWETNKKPLRFVTANFRLTTNVTIGKIRELLTGEPASPTDDVIGLFQSFGISHNINADYRPINGRDTLVITTNALNTSGSIRITEKWSIMVGNIGYDFRSKQITYPSFNFTRDMHCWEMIMGWFPEIGAYTFMIKVKPSTLEFIKVPYRRNAVGNFVGFGF